MPADRPFGFEALRVSLQRQQLNQAELIRYAPSGQSVSVEAVMESLSGPGTVVPVDELGHVSYVRYMRNNNLVVGWFRFYFGTGSTFGSTYWRLALPVPPSTLDSDPRPVGDYQGFDASSGQYNRGFLTLINSATPAIVFQYIASYPTGFLTTLGPAFPWTWAVGDYLQGYFTYEADTGYAP